MTAPVYIDSNVFILPLLHGESDQRARDATGILRKIETRKISAYTSILTWDEVTWVILKTLGRPDSAQAGKRLLQFPNLRFVEVSDSVITKSQFLIENYGIKPRDAIHCSSALVKGIRIVVSDDADFEVVDGIKRASLETFAKA